MMNEKETNNHNNLRTLEEIDEERDSLPDQESLENDKIERKVGNAISDFKKSIDSLSKSEDFEPKEPRRRHLSINTSELEENRRLDSQSENDDFINRNAGGRFTRHSSIDQKYNHLKHPQHQGVDETIEKYYERNHYTVTGNDRDQDFYKKLPLRLQPKTGNLDASSRLSSPGALGEDVIPTTRRFDKSVYWFAFLRKKVGLRHICTILLVLFYTLLGAAVFYSIESKHERETTLLHVKRLEDLLHTLSNNITNIVNDPATNTTVSEMKLYIREAYISLIKLEDQYMGSTYHKLEDMENNWKWTFKSAFFFSMNVYTTTGYGSIAPESDLGKCLTCVYGFIFVPVTLAALRDLGQLCLVFLTWAYAHIIQRLRELNGNNTIDHNELIRIPIFACLNILTVYLLFCTFFIYFYDDLSGKEENSGISMFNSFYFSFISLSTIGLGDVMPNNATFSPIISILFFFGMCLTKVVNRTTYIAVENGIFGFYTMLENALDNAMKKSQQDISPESIGVRACRQSANDAISTSPEEATTNEMLNNFTVRSIATFMKSNADIYGGGFGRVQIRRGDLINNDNQSTINNIAQLRQRAPSQTAVVNKEKEASSSNP